MRNLNKYIFTFGSNQLYAGFYQPIYAPDPNTARAKMVDLHGTNWAFQYTEEQWKETEEEARALYTLEKPLEAVYCE